MRSLKWIPLVMMLVVASCSNAPSDGMRHRDYVSTDSTAVAIATAVWTPLLGEAVVRSSRLTVSSDLMEWRVVLTTDTRDSGALFNLKGEYQMFIERYDGRISRLVTTQ
jgi:hypothetical protein